MNNPRNLPTKDKSSKSSVLLIAHGSRRAEANHDLVKLAELISARGQYDHVQVSYLELVSPTILEGGRMCVQRGATRVLMLPYFLSAGVHVVMDLEESRKQLATEFSMIEFRLCPHLGLHPLMADIVLARLSESSQTATNPSGVDFKQEAIEIVPKESLPSHQLG